MGGQRHIPVEYLGDVETRDTHPTGKVGLVETKLAHPAGNPTKNAEQMWSTAVIEAYCKLFG